MAPVRGSTILRSSSSPLRLCLLALVASSTSACGADSKRSAAPETGAAVRWLGRVDLSDAGAPRFSWSGTGFAARVAGAVLSVKLRTEGAGDDVFVQPVVDGTALPRVKVPYGEQTAVVASGLTPGEHELFLTRESEGKLGSSVFGGFVQGTLKAPPPARERLIEIIGDSISAGYGNLGKEQHLNSEADPNGGCRFSTETESAYLTYGAIAARALDADSSIIALSGWGAYRDNGNSQSNVLAKVYERTLGTSPNPAWGFEPKPQVVVINLGTNDFANGDPGQSEFSGAYSALLAKVRGKYPDAWIFCMIGPLLYGAGLTAATTYITSVVDSANASGDDKVRLFDVGQQNASLGTGCDWHPSVAEHERMADLLVAAVRPALGW